MSEVQTDRGDKPGDDQGFTLGPAYRGPELRRWQISALNNWSRAGKRGIVEAITGTGKSLVGIVAIHQTVVVEGGKALVVVPTVALVSQWERAIAAALPTARVGAIGGGRSTDFRQSDVIVATVQSAYKAPPVPTSLGLLVADEVHRYGSASFSKALHDRYERRLGLTGTLERQLDDGVARYLVPYFRHTVMQYGYGPALADKVVAPFDLALVGVEFTGSERREYDATKERCNEAMTSLIELFGYPADWEAFFGLVSARVAERATVWDEERQLCSSYMSAFAERRRLTAEASAKESVVEVISHALADLSGSLIFTETKDSAWRLAWIVNKATPAFSLDGDSSAAVREEKLCAFGNGRLRVITAPRILDEGIDVPEAEFALIVAASQSARQMIQRMGRVIRLKKDSRSARIMVLYVRDSGEDPEHGGHYGFLSQIRPFASTETMMGAEHADDLIRWLAA